MNAKRTFSISALAIAALALLISTQACSRKAVPPRQADREAVTKAYFAALDEATRNVKIYDGLETRAYLNAAYKSAELRKAYARLYAASYQLDQGYEASLLEREGEEAEKYNEFFFTAFTPDEKWNDFSRTDSIWKIFLVDDSGAKLSPISIKKIDSSDPVLRNFFPFFDIWSSGYIIKFPKYTETGSEPIPGPKTAYLRLVVTGLLGKGEMEWRFKK